MSKVLIRMAFEKRLANPALIAALPTAYQNDAYTPIEGTPYQRINLLMAQPDAPFRGSAGHFQRGVFQIMLCYPLNSGVRAIETRGELLAALFKRGTTMTESGLLVQIIEPPHVGDELPPDGDRFSIPVSVTFQAQIATP